MQGITVAGETVFAAQGGVLGHEPDIASLVQDPFCVVVASDNESDFATNTENRRQYGFSIRVYMERNTRGPQEAEDDLTEIVDEIVNTFDRDFTLGGEALVTTATPSSWQYILGTKEYRIAEIIIRALVWFDTTS